MEILNYREQNPNSNPLAIFDIIVPALGMTFRKWKLMRNKNGNLFISGPSYSETDGSGQKIWFQYVSVDEKRRNDFNKAVMEALKPFLREPF